MAIPPSFLQELIARVDVAEVVGRHVQLKKAGANFSGLCPFHAEKSPSFTVSPSKQFYHCFGCGKNGNAIGFLMDHLSMGFIEAVKDLAQQVGLQVPEEDLSPQDRAQAAAQRDKRATLSDVLEKAAEAYKKQLKTSPKAIAYLKGRGLSGEVAKAFGIGYSPEGWRTLAGVFPQYDDPLLAESGLVIVNEDDADNAKRYDRFRDRIMFPIRNVKGECIGFGGRVLGDEKPKYLNSPETPVFSKGHELYGLFEARTALREHGYALVTEGYMDVVALAQLGFPNTVATLGTACTAEHVQKLFRFTDAVVFSFDGDAAGQRAAHKALHAALPHASDVRSVKFLFLPPEHDPDSFIREFGNAAFAQKIDAALPLSRFMLQAASEGCDLQSAEGRARFASQAQPLWTPLPDGAFKRQLMGEIAERVQLDSRELLQLWGGSAKAGNAARRSNYPPRTGDAGQPDAATPEAAGRYPNSSNSYALDKSRSPKAPLYSATGRRWAGRQLPASRADHAARLLLGHSAHWPSLSHEMQALLCELPAPHGPLFVWLDAQLHEHGPLPWAALREGLAAHPAQPLTLRLMDSAQQLAVNESADNTSELHDLLNRLLKEHLQAQQTQAIASSDLPRYRELQSRLQALDPPAPTAPLAPGRNPTA
ncbi:MAG: DNA primase [Burkholderiales bacterium]